MCNAAVVYSCGRRRREKVCKRRKGGWRPICCSAAVNIPEKQCETDRESRGWLLFVAQSLEKGSECGTTAYLLRRWVNTWPKC